MDGQHFDRLTRQFTSSLSRRRLGGVLTALGLAAGLGRSSPTDAKKGKKKKKKKPKKCKNGTVKCGKACVNTQTDDLHCGTCGNACQGDLTCVSGDCECAEGTTCGNQCVNTQTDEDHCGECDEPCGGGTTCQGGQCVSAGNCTPACSGDQICDGGECVCPSERPAFCGGQCHECCGHVDCTGNPNGNQCIIGLVCGCQQTGDGWNHRPCGPNGACSRCCSNADCLQVNGEGWICTAGDPSDGRSCVCDAQNGYTPCSNRCSNLQTDTSDCGSCDRRCCTGENCSELLREICVQGDCCRPINQFCEAHADCCSGSCNFEILRCNGPG